MSALAGQTSVPTTVLTHTHTAQKTVFCVRLDGKKRTKTKLCTPPPKKNNPKLRFSLLSLFISASKVQDVETEAQILTRVWDGRDSAVFFFFLLLSFGRCWCSEEEDEVEEEEGGEEFTRVQTSGMKPQHSGHFTLNKCHFCFLFIIKFVPSLLVFLPHLPGCKYQVRCLDYLKNFKTKTVAHLPFSFFFSPSGLDLNFFCCRLLSVFAWAPTLPSWIRCRPICSFGYLCLGVCVWVCVCVRGRVLSM